MNPFIVLLISFFLSTCAWAQEDNLMNATSALQDVLSTLKDSVDKLNVNNSKLAAKDNYIRNQISLLQVKLAKLSQDGAVLNKAEEPLRQNNDRFSKQINELESEIFGVDNETQKDEGEIRLAQQSMDAGYHEDEKLLLQLKKMAPVLGGQAVPSPIDDEALKMQKEKLKIIKMIYESRERQAAIHQSILDFQKNSPQLPAVSDMAQQAVLKSQINALQTEIAAYPPVLPASVNANWDDDQLEQLEGELNVLERDYHQLKELMAQMNQRVQSNKLSSGEEAEAQQLRHHIENLDNESQGLRADLDDLRSQMVDLDKRKSHLEELIKQLP